jgi:5-hydroxyisourate hydrolase-like protein (transthyretin family)
VLSLDAAENGAFAPSAGVRADGGFELANASSGAQLLRASAPGYGPAWKALDDVGDGETRLGIVIALAREGRVAGSVLRADGTPVAGSLLLATTTDFESKRPCLTYASTLTDGAGRYEIGGLSPGGWAVLEFGPTAGLVRGRYAPEMAFTRIRTGETARVDFHEKRPVQVLRGVLLGTGGEPVAGRTVMVAPLERALPPPEGGWTSATTGSDGSYRIPDLEPGPHEMFVSGRLPPEMTRVGRFEVGDGPETVHDVRLPGGSIAGRVLDGERGEPLDLAVLVLYRRDGDANEFVAKAFSDAQGRYEIPYLADGRYELYAHASREPYGQERRVDLVVEGGAALEDVELTLRLGGTLAIVARDASGAPLAQASIELVDASGDPVEFSGDQRTDEAGRFAVSGIRPGAWRVRALSGGRIVAEQDVEIAPGARSEVELVAAPR